MRKWIIAAVVAVALFFGGTARAAGCTTTPATNAALAAAVSSGSPGDVICLNAGQQYSPSNSLDVTRNLTIETDPAQIASGGVAAILNGGSMTGASTIDTNQLDLLVVGNAVLHKKDQDPALRMVYKDKFELD